MGDLQFAKQFLTSLDNKTTKYQPDHVFDPKTFQLRIPVSGMSLDNPVEEAWTSAITTVIGSLCAQQDDTSPRGAMGLLSC